MRIENGTLVDKNNFRYVPIIRGTPKNTIPGYSNDVEVIIYPNPTGTLRDNDCVITGIFLETSELSINSTEISPIITKSLPCSVTSIKDIIISDSSYGGVKFLVSLNSQYDNSNFIDIVYRNITSNTQTLTKSKISFIIKCIKEDITDINIL